MEQQRPLLHRVVRAYEKSTRTLRYTSAYAPPAYAFTTATEKRRHRNGVERKSSTCRGRLLPLKPRPQFAVPFAAGGGRAGAEAVGLGAGFEDVGVEGDAVDDGGDQAGVGEDGAPFAEGQVGGDGRRRRVLRVR